MKIKSFEDLKAILQLPQDPQTAQNSHGPRNATKPGTEPAPTRGGHDGRGSKVRLVIDRKGRKGKTVTLVTGLRHNPDTMGEIAHHLKERCGTGGTVKDGMIELQGDQRERAKVELEKMNYVVAGHSGSNQK